MCKAGAEGASTWSTGRRAQPFPCQAEVGADLPEAVSVTGWMPGMASRKEGNRGRKPAPA